MSTTLADLHLRIAERDIDLVVVGQGYVGLSLAAAAAVEGMRVTGIDIDEERITALAAGRNIVPGVEDGVFAMAVDSGNLSFSSGYAAVESADIVVICVPTPVVDHRPELRAIESAGRLVGERLRAGTLVVLESTTWAGTTEQVLAPLLEVNGLRAGADFHLAFSPERIDPGNTKYGLRNTPRVVGGINPDSTKSAALFYSQLVDDVTELSSARAAEMAKLLENTFRMVNIALVNELAMLCADQGIDTWEVIRAAGTKPFGFMPFYPGPGVGGHCIPLDPTYLAWQSRRDTGRRFRLVEMAQDLNAEMPAYVATRIIDALGSRGVPVSHAKVLVLGVTYKPNVGDLRESAAVEVMSRLVRRGARVTFHDPFVEHVGEHGLDLNRTTLTTDEIAAADAVAVLTPHDTYDFDEIMSHARFVFDARNSLGVRDHADVVTL
jgi:UDP-N-acetyl-D-glucosamine dehydrogenase